MRLVEAGPCSARWAAANLHSALWGPMPTSAHWDVTNSPQISVKSGTFCRADVGIGPYTRMRGSL